MTIEKCKDFIKDGYGTWDDTSKPTTYANMYDFMKNQNNIVMNLASGIWQPSTAYTIGTIIRSPNLPAGCVATCTTAGTSGTTEPKWTAYGTTVTDGTCKWKVNTDSQDTMVSEMNKAIKSEIEATKSEMVDIFYPVGTVYMSADKSKTKADFPFMQYGTWEEVPANLCLQTGNASEAGTQRSAGLPNITGRLAVPYEGGYGHFISKYDHEGMVQCALDRGDGYQLNGQGGYAGNGWKSFDTVNFDASLSNPIYGSSDTVQPPSYMVRAWVRTA